MSCRAPWIRWTKEEEELLRNLYPTSGPRAVHEALLGLGCHRTVAAIKVRAENLGVRISPERKRELATTASQRNKAYMTQYWAELPAEERVRRASLTKAQNELYWTSETRSQHSIIMTPVIQKRWASASDEERQQYGLKMKAAWERRSPLEKEAHAEVTRKNSLVFWAGLTPEERLEMRNKIGTGIRDAYQALNAQEWAARFRNRGQNLRAWWAALSEEEQARHKEKWGQNMKRVSWASISEEESARRRLFFSQNTKRANAERSDEKCKELSAKRSAILKDRWANASPEYARMIHGILKGNVKFVRTQNGQALPNRAEQVIIDFGIRGLIPTLTLREHRVLLRHEDGSLWRKNPDFSFAWEGPSHDGKPALVVEVMGFGRWHSTSEVPHLVQEYARVGVLCLVVDSQELFKATREVENRIKTGSNTVTRDSSRAGI